MLPTLLRTCLACLLCVLISGPVAAQTVDLAALKRQVGLLERDLRNIDTAIERQQTENARLIDDLGQIGEQPRVVTFENLRQAQFEVDIARTRMLTLTHRMTEQSQRIAQMNSEIVSATAALSANQRDTLQRLVEEAAIDWRDRIRALTNTLVERLSAYQGLTQEYLNLREEQLDILQRHISLDDLDGVGDEEDSPVAAAGGEEVAVEEDALERRRRLEARARRLLVGPRGGRRGAVGG